MYVQYIYNIKKLSTILYNRIIVYNMLAIATPIVPPLLNYIAIAPGNQ